MVRRANNFNPVATAIPPPGFIFLGQLEAGEPYEVDHFWKQAILDQPVGYQDLIVTLKDGRNVILPRRLADITHTEEQLEALNKQNYTLVYLGFNGIMHICDLIRAADANQ